MAYDYSFGPGPALDPNLELVASASGEVYAAAEGGDTLTIRVNGVEVGTLESDANGLIQAFEAEVPSVWVDLGTGRFRINSWDGVVEAAETARDAAQAAQGAAEDARDAAETAGALVIPPGGDAGMVLAKRTSEDRDTMWVIPTGGGGGGGQILVWRYSGGGYPDLPAARPAGVVTVEAQGPSQPTNPPSWVGLSAGAASLLYTFVPLS